ncbi:hypothetical protein KP509_13G033900 [Ceratopteris richardii]|uniref:Uncharacterized protein n=1 Tax=Ceratopteris richardii TaxID=49495 RepID=A0A8T2THT9_CERRI|nr:hypothetical protein KP509_13G033900 [Ceratopteris richardii]
MRSLPSLRSDDPKGEGKGTKPSGTNQRGIIDDYVFDNHPSDHEIDTSAIDEELDSPDGLVERITGKISSVKQEIKEFAHEVKEFIDRSMNR